MNVNDFQTEALRTVNDDPIRDMKACFALGLVGEAAEVSELVKKELFHGHHEDRDRVKDELGDVLFYVAVVAYLYDLSLSQVAAFNIVKRENRYPDGFSHERSRNRNE